MSKDMGGSPAREALREAESRRRMEYALKLLDGADGLAVFANDACRTISVEEVCEEVALHMVGRTEETRQVVEFLRMRERIRQLIVSGCPREELPACKSMMLVGPTASSKSYLMSCVAKAMRYHYVSVSLASLTGVGWKGRSIEDVLCAIGRYQKENAGRMTLLMLDECDKHRFVEGSRSDEMTANPAVDLLKILDNESGVHHGLSEGADYYVNLDDLIVVFAGAYQYIPEIVRRRLAASAGSGCGFLVSGEASDIVAMDDDALRSCVSHEDLVAYGLISELVGRAGYLCLLPSLTEEELRRIVNDHPNSLEARSQRLMRTGVTLTISDEAALAMARRARKSSLGARMIENMAQPVIAHAVAVAYACKSVAAIQIGWNAVAEELVCDFVDVEGCALEALS